MSKNISVYNFTPEQHAKIKLVSRKILELFRQEQLGVEESLACLYAMDDAIKKVAGIEKIFTIKDSDYKPFRGAD